MRDYAKITVSRKGEPFLKKGQTRMYANNVVSMSEGAENGSPADIVTEDGEYIGTGYLSLNSHVRVRILTRDPDILLDRAFYQSRFRDAWRYRRAVCGSETDNCRLVFSEADRLPGLVADRYNDLIVTQISTCGMEKNKDMIYGAMLDVMQEEGQVIHGIYERNDTPSRTKEGLPLYKGFWKDTGMSPRTVIRENGLKLNVDVENGQKTGYFLDQKSNRLLIRSLAKDMTVMDCFSHTGGFALNAAYGGAKHVDAVDISRTALQQAEANAVLNGLEKRMSFVQADVFEHLGTIEKGTYDLIILDPPAFTKSRRTHDHAFQGYKRINKKAMELLNDGSYLATCSCSRFMESQDFEIMLRESAEEAGVMLKQLSCTQQNADHPILWNNEDTSYLKFYLFQILEKGR